MKSILTATGLRELLSYDPDTGDFRWLADKSRKARAGELAGHKNKLGYVVLKVDGGTYKAHRLAWLYVYGEFPNGFLDHINGAPGDNRIFNLRQASRSENG